MKNMTKEEAIRKYVDEMDVEDLSGLVQDVNGYDGQLEWLVWEDMGLLDEFLDGYTPTQIALMIHFGDFNPNHEYFRFNAYRNLESCYGDDWDKQLDESRGDIADVLLNFDGDVSDSLLQYLVDAPDDATFDENFEEVDVEDED